MAFTARFPDASVFPLTTLDPAAPADDLDPLLRLIPDHVRVIAIGESAHGAREYYLLRHRLIRFLVSRMQFTALAWESGFPEGFLVDDYIQGHHDDRERALVDGMTMHMGRCQEMADLLEWLRAHNAEHADAGSRDHPVHQTEAAHSGRVRFHGLDLPGSGAMLRAAFEVVAAYAERVDARFGPRYARLRELAASFKPGVAQSPTPSRVVLPGTAVIQQYTAIPAADRNELTALLAEFAARFDALRRSFVERSNPADYDLARQHLRMAAQLDLQLRAVAAFMAGDAAACEANIRDLAMAETVRWLLGCGHRVIVAAHNGHIQRTPISTVAGMSPVDTLGVHLGHQLGEQYLTIATTCGGGEIIGTRTTSVEGAPETELVIRDLPAADAGTLDNVLESALGRTALLDLRTAGPQSAAAIDPACRMRVQDHVLPIDARRSFDLLIHIPRISIWNSPLNAILPDLRTAGPGAT